MMKNDQSVALEGLRDVIIDNIVASLVDAADKIDLVDVFIDVAADLGDCDFTRRLAVDATKLWLDDCMGGDDE